MSAADPPSVDVVVLTWNDGDLLVRASSSVRRSSGLRTSLIVVDNGSNPRPPSVQADQVLRLPRNLGVAIGRTLGTAAGTAPFVCFLDSDAELHPQTLGRLVDHLVHDPTIALAAPVFDGQEPAASAGRAPSLVVKAQRALNRRAQYRPGELAPDGLLDVDFAIGACQVFRRAAWDEVGGLDTTYFYGPEDVDFCLRLKIAGWRVVQDPAATCTHSARRTFKNLRSRRGFSHAAAVARHLWKHRTFRWRSR